MREMQSEDLRLLMGFDESISGHICLSMSQYFRVLKCVGHTTALHPTYGETVEGKGPFLFFQIH